MTKQTNLIPRKRFREFQNTHAWEQRKLGEMCVIGDIDHRMPDSVSDGIPYIMTGDFIGINGLDFENSKKISLKDYEQLSQKIKPEQGDILFARYASVGTVRYVETLKKFLISYSCAILKPDETINGKYLFYYLQSDKCQQQIESEINTGSQRNIGIDSLKKIKIFVPSIKEQSLISELLIQLDNLIALHQHKLEKTKALKSAYLSEMFPAEGECKSKRRFAGFTKTWKPQAISELAERYDNLRIPITASDRIAGDTPYYGANGIQGYVEGFTHDGEFILVAEDGANDLQNYPIQYVNGKVWVNNHAHVLQAKSEVADNKFLMNAMKHMNIEPYLVGGGRAKLNADVMMKISFRVPELAEQKMIGSFFSSLDHLIELHQRKLEKLQNLKKAYLNEMFV